MRAWKICALVASVSLLVALGSGLSSSNSDARLANVVGGLVWADERRSYIRLVFEPETAFSRSQGTDDYRTNRPFFWQAETFIIVARPGRVPRFRLKSIRAGARVDPAGRLIPVWTPRAVSDHETPRRRAALIRDRPHSAHRRDGFRPASCQPGSSSWLGQAQRAAVG